MLRKRAHYSQSRHNLNVMDKLAQIMAEELLRAKSGSGSHGAVGARISLETLNGVWDSAIRQLFVNASHDVSAQAGCLLVELTL